MAAASARKTAVVTGASSGVGRAGAIELAGLGWNVIGLGRDPGRSSDALAAIQAASHPDARIAMLTGDLALLADAARLADEILAIGASIHALCNNAGGVRSERSITPEGNEATFSGNHLGHFLLTKRLIPRLRETAQGEGHGSVRIIAVSSEGHRQAPEFDWGDLQSSASWSSGVSYCRAKLCNLLFTQELARRLAPQGIVAHGMHPGEAATNFASHAPPEMQAYMDKLDMISPELAGRTMAWLAASEEAGRISGGYFFDCQSVEPSPASKDLSLAKRLWTASDALLARCGF